MRPYWHDGINGTVIGLVTGRFERHGFLSRFNSKTFYRERDDIVDSASPLIDCSPTDNRISVSLNLGIGRYESPLDRGRRTPSLTWNIGYLIAGRWIEWSVERAADLEPAVDEMLHCFEEVAIPWLARFQETSDVLREERKQQPRGFRGLKRAPRPRIWYDRLGA